MNILFNHNVNHPVGKPGNAKWKSISTPQVCRSRSAMAPRLGRGGSIMDQWPFIHDWGFPKIDPLNQS